MLNKMNKEQLKSIINAFVGYSEQKIYDAIDEYDNEKIIFTKHHVSEALKAASEKAEITEDVIFNLACGDNPEYESVINKESILNAYSLNNIK